MLFPYAVDSSLSEVIVFITGSDITKHYSKASCISTPDVITALSPTTPVILIIIIMIVAGIYGQCSPLCSVSGEWCSVASLYIALVVL